MNARLNLQQQNRNRLLQALGSAPPPVPPQIPDEPLENLRPQVEDMSKRLEEKYKSLREQLKTLEQEEIAEQGASVSSSNLVSPPTTMTSESHLSRLSSIYPQLQANQGFKSRIAGVLTQITQDSAAPNSYSVTGNSLIPVNIRRLQVRLAANALLGQCEAYLNPIHQQQLPQIPLSLSNPMNPYPTLQIQQMQMLQARQQMMMMANKASLQQQPMFNQPIIPNQQTPWMSQQLQLPVPFSQPVPQGLDGLQAMSPSPEPIEVEDTPIKLEEQDGFQIISNPSSSEQAQGGDGPSQPGSSRVHSMQQFHQQDAPCFAGDCQIRLADGSSVRLDQLRRGMEVETGDGKTGVVAAVVKTVMEQGKAVLCRIGELKVTPWHPIVSPLHPSSDGLWVFPASIAEPEWIACDAIYSILLQQPSHRKLNAEHHSVMISGVRCVTLGHGIIADCTDVRAHSFLGDYEAVLRSISKLDGFEGEEGIVVCGGVVKSRATGLVSGFVPPIVMESDVRGDLKRMQVAVPVN
jgi:hypothetical protein